MSDACDRAQRQQAQTEMEETEHVKTFYGEGGHALKQVAKRGCGISILGNIQNSAMLNTALSNLL